MRFVKGFALNCHSDACRGSELSLHKQLENYEVRSTRLLYFILIDFQIKWTVLRSKKTQIFLEIGCSCTCTYLVHAKMCIY